MKPTSIAARIHYMLDCGVPSVDNLYKIINYDQKEQKGKRSSAKGKEGNTRGQEKKLGWWREQLIVTLGN